LLPSSWALPLVELAKERRRVDAELSEQWRSVESKKVGSTIRGQTPSQRMQELVLRRRQLAKVCQIDGSARCPLWVRRRKELESNQVSARASSYEDEVSGLALLSEENAEHFQAAFEGEGLHVENINIRFMDNNGPNYGT
jgi:hypothetical protein